MLVYISKSLAAKACPQKAVISVFTRWRRVNLLDGGHVRYVRPEDHEDLPSQSIVPRTVIRVAQLHSSWRRNGVTKASTGRRAHAVTMELRCRNNRGLAVHPATLYALPSLENRQDSSDIGPRRDDVSGFGKKEPVYTKQPHSRHDRRWHTTAPTP